MRRQFLLLIIVLTGIQLLAQDTLVFSQKNSAMFSNKYFLYPKSKTFEHKFKTDDGQIWYGKGTYKIKKRKLFLSFGDSEKGIKEINRITKIYSESKITDTLIVRFFDKIENPPIGHIKFKSEYFYTGIEGGLVKIPKSKFENKQNPIVETFIQRALVNIELTNVSKLNTVEIIASHIYGIYHFESNFERVLKYRKNELKSIDFYKTTRKQRVTFVMKKTKANKTYE
jgi:hypothetical protein